MKKRILLAALALCLCTSSMPVVHAGQKFSPSYENVFTEESTSELITCDSTVPSPQEVYESMIALKDQEAYREGTTWTDYEPYSDTKGHYKWKGGPLGGKNIVAVGCVAFAFTLSDTAFGDLPARMYEASKFSFEDVKVGDILRVNTDTHTVIVLEVSDTGVIIAEGNFGGKVHWGRSMSKDEVMRDTSHYITRYPEGYIAPDDPTANEILESGILTTGLTWNLTKAGTLTISGNGAMPTDFSGPSDQPWNSYSSQIRKIIIEEGITSIGSSAFYGNGALSVEIPNSVTSIGNNAFRECSLIYASIPSGVKTIGDDAFRQCSNLTSVTVSEGVEIIGQRAFRGCVKLSSVDLPASAKEMGAGAFYDCTKLMSVTFASGSNQVKMGEDLFARCWSLYDLTLPQSIDCISTRMFQSCSGMLFNVMIPQGAAKIGESAFASCAALIALVIPDSVTEIETGAFSDCKSLTDIYFTGTKAQWDGIWKANNVKQVLANVTIHYEYNPDDKPEPTAAPTQEPTTAPTQEPTTAPTQEPTTAPTQEPTTAPTQKPTTEPTAAPTQKPTTEPTAAPTQKPTTEPTAAPTQKPTTEPTTAPTQKPTTEPTAAPTQKPTTEPTAAPTQKPTTEPTAAPTQKPTTEPTAAPTQEPTAAPTQEPTTEPSPIPGTKEPFIKDDAGKKGWQAIKEEAVNAFDGKWVNVNMNGVSTVPGYVLDSVKGQNVTISFEMDNGIAWFVKGTTITADRMNNIDLSVQIVTSAIPQEMVDEVAGERQTTQISLAHSGDFGCSAVLMINMDSANAGRYANLFYHNERDGRLEFVTADQIRDNGIAELKFMHASNYVIVVGDDVMDGNSDEDSSEDDEESTSDNDNNSQGTNIQSPKTGECDIKGFNVAELQPEGNVSNPIWLFLIGVAGMAVAGTIIFLVYKKVKK